MADQATAMTIDPQDEAMPKGTEGPSQQAADQLNLDSTDQASLHSLRPYQKYLLGIAQKQNVIVVLDTDRILCSAGMESGVVLELAVQGPPYGSTLLENRGSGKTRIAQELILSSRSEAKARGQAAVFLAPTIPLVLQQGLVLESAGLLVSRHFESAATLLARTMCIKGETRQSLEPKRWEYELANKDVLCMTPEFLVVALMHAYVSMNDISVMVFDEAHHARASHPYAVIMQDFYATAAPTSRLPRILGLTASPVQLLDVPETNASGTPVDGQLQQQGAPLAAKADMVIGPSDLEIILDASIVTVRDR
eukprot:gene15036-21107_t